MMIHLKNGNGREKKRNWRMENGKGKKKTREKRERATD